jgi:hypothetical protein
MKNFRTYDEFLLEFQKKDVSLLETLDDYFTIGFEIEMDTDHRRIRSLPTPPKIITNESKKLNVLSIQDRRKVMDIKNNFPNFFRKYFDILEYHYEGTVSSGMEFVTPPFHSLQESKEFIKIFFEDFEKQNKWFFNDKTSIHINIGTKKPKSRWNVVKGVMMLSDDYTFKNIEARKTCGYCSSLKTEIFMMIINNDKNYQKTSNNRNITDMNKNQIENLIEQIIQKIFTSTQKTYNINFWKLFNKNYVEFRQVGGENINENIVINKMMYFVYCVYLMTSSYKKDEYIRKLFSFVEKIRKF